MPLICVRPFQGNRIEDNLVSRHEQKLDNNLIQETLFSRKLAKQGNRITSTKNAARSPVSCLACMKKLVLHSLKPQLVLHDMLLRVSGTLRTPKHAVTHAKKRSGSQKLTRPHLGRKPTGGLPRTSDDAILREQCFNSCMQYHLKMLKCTRLI